MIRHHTFFIVAIGGIILYADQVNAELLAYDGADSAPTSSINGRGGGEGWSGGWAGNDNVASDGLTTAGLVAVRNRFLTDGNNTGSFRSIQTAGHADLITGGDFGKDGTVLWASFLYRPETRTPNNYSGFSLYNSPSGQQLYVGVPTGQTRLGLFAAASGGFQLSNVEATLGKTFFVVVRMEFGAGFTDRVTLFVDPDLGNEPSAGEAAATLSGASITFDRILISSGNSATTASFDEIRIGESFRDVAPGESEPENEQKLEKVHEFGGPNRALTGVLEGGDGRLYIWDRGAGAERQGSISSVKKDGTDSKPVHKFEPFPNDVTSAIDLIYGTGGVLYGAAGPTVFAVNVDGTDFRTVRRWSLDADGTAGPSAITEGSDGVLYGWTGVGGTRGSPKLFRINKDGTAYKELHNFEAGLGDPDAVVGAAPSGRLTEGSDGRLYGLNGGGLTAGGVGDLGRVYRLNRDGSGFENIHNFTGNGQGSGPFGQLLHATDGFLYGIGHGGGESNRPVIFKLKPDGSEYNVILTADVANTNFLNHLIESSDGFLYGTTTTVRAFLFGTIYRVKPDGTEFKELHTFSTAIGNADPLGDRPSPPLHSRDGNLYFITDKQTTFQFPVLWTMHVLKFGPVPLSTSTPSNAPPSLSVGFEPQGRFVITFTGEPGQVFKAQSTDSLPPNWSAGESVTIDAQGDGRFTDETAKNSRERYYRVVDD